MFVLGPRLAGAQGGGTVEVEVKYNGAPVVEKLKVNKDTEKCGTETTIEKSWSAQQGARQRRGLRPERQGRRGAKKVVVTSTAASSFRT